LQKFATMLVIIDISRDIGLQILSKSEPAYSEPKKNYKSLAEQVIKPSSKYIP